MYSSNDLYTSAAAPAAPAEVTFLGLERQTASAEHVLPPVLLSGPTVVLKQEPDGSFVCPNCDKTKSRWECMEWSTDPEDRCRDCHSQHYCCGYAPDAPKQE